MPMTKEMIKTIGLYVGLVLLGAPLLVSVGAVFAYVIFAPWVWLYLQLVELLT